MSRVKALALLRKRDDISREDFIAYYEQQHAPLIRSLFPMIGEYRRNFADFSSAYVNPDAAPFDFDCVTEFHFASEDDWRAFQQRAADPEVMARVFADEANFIASGHNRMFLVEERATSSGEH